MFLVEQRIEPLELGSDINFYYEKELWITFWDEVG